ncbi:MAG: cyclic nucleotide-binding domain-containing protein [Clostridiales bacterium]|nr:cyclic nucleotide-binding domain-containing protein [Clostridiales bacterium]
MDSIKKTYVNGEIIIKEGDIGNSFFQLLSGSAGVYVNYGEADQVKLTVLNEGQYFGEMAVIEAFPRSSTVVAEGSVEAIEIPGSELNTYFTENPDKIIELIKHIGNRLRALTDDYDEAKAILKKIENPDEDKSNETFLTKLAKHIGFYKLAKVDLTAPSAEALREQSKDLSKGETTATYPKGTIIYKKGEVSNCMYILHSGSVGIYYNYGEANELMLTELLPVAFFGEMGMLAGKERSATAVAKSNETYLEIVRLEDLESMFKTSPVKVDMILRHLSYRLRSLTIDYFNTCKKISEAYS